MTRRPALVGSRPHLPFLGMSRDQNKIRSPKQQVSESMPSSSRKKDWILTQEAFRGLLEWLDQGSDTGGRNYLEMRRRLVGYFDRKNCATPDELADETLNRVARRLEEEGAITGAAAAQYCYIVARFVFHEHLRSAQRHYSTFSSNTGAEGAGDSEIPVPHPAASPALDEEEERERRMGCLEKCLSKLEEDSRELISEYYQGEQREKIEHRRQLASRLGLTVNALSIRACRIRARLETCVTKCCSED